jgi:hypothetical protein
MFGRRKDLRRIVDADDGVARRMHDQQRLAHARDVVPELLPEMSSRTACVPEWAAANIDLGLAMRSTAALSLMRCST